MARALGYGFSSDGSWFLPLVRRVVVLDFFRGISLSTHGPHGPRLRLQPPQTTFAALRCRDLAEDVSVLEADYTISCDSSDYEVLRAFAVMVTLAIPIGIPLGTYLLLRKHEPKILAHGKNNWPTHWAKRFGPKHLAKQKNGQNI